MAQNCGPDSDADTEIAAGPGIRTTASHRIHPADPGSVVTLMVDQNGIIGRLIGKFMAGLTNRSWPWRAMD